MCVYISAGGKTKTARKTAPRSHRLLWTDLTGDPPSQNSLLVSHIHHTQYHDRHPHPHLQVCHFALFLKLYRASGWRRGGGCAFALRFVAPCIIIDQASRSSLCPLWSCPLARHGHPHSRHLCGLAYAEREEGLNLMA